MCVCVLCCVVCAHMHACIHTDKLLSVCAFVLIHTENNHPFCPIFTGNIEQLKQQHEKEMEEFEKAQETNKARLEQGLEEKLRERRNRRARMTSPS